MVIFWTAKYWCKFSFASISVTDYTAFYLIKTIRNKKMVQYDRLSTLMSVPLLELKK